MGIEHCDICAEQATDMAAARTPKTTAPKRKPRRFMPSPT